MGTAIRYHDKNGNLLTYDPALGNYIQVDPFRVLPSPSGKVFPSSTLIILTPRESNFAPTTLGNTEHTYVSPEYNDVIALDAYFSDWSCQTKIKEGPYHSITVQVPWNTISNEDFFISNAASEQWEIIPNQGQKSLITNGLLANPFTAVSSVGNYVVLPDVMKVAVQRAYENKSLALTIPAGMPNSASLAAYLPYATKILNYLRGGVEGVPSYTQTLKRTQTVDVRNINGAFQQVADSLRKDLNAQGTVNYMLSYQDMIGNFSIQPAVQQCMMPSYAKQITVTGLEPAQYYAYAGYLVSPPHPVWTTPNKLQLTQYFIWDEWLSGMFYIFSPAGHFPVVANPSSSPSGYDPTP